MKSLKTAMTCHGRVPLQSQQYPLVAHQPHEFSNPYCTLNNSVIIVARNIDQVQ